MKRGTFSFALILTFALSLVFMSCTGTPDSDSQNRFSIDISDKWECIADNWISHEQCQRIDFELHEGDSVNGFLYIEIYPDWAYFGDGQKMSFNDIVEATHIELSFLNCEKYDNIKLGSHTYGRFFTPPHNTHDDYWHDMLTHVTLVGDDMIRIRTLLPSLTDDNDKLYDEEMLQILKSLKFKDLKMSDFQDY